MVGDGCEVQRRDRSRPLEGCITCWGQHTRDSREDTHPPQNLHRISALAYVHISDSKPSSSHISLCMSLIVTHIVAFGSILLGGCIYATSPLTHLRSY